MQGKMEIQSRNVLKLAGVPELSELFNILVHLNISNSTLSGIKYFYSLSL